MSDSSSEWENCPVADELWAVISWNNKDPDRDGEADLAVIEVALGREAAQTLIWGHARRAELTPKSLEIVDLDRLASLDEQGETIVVASDVQLCFE